MTMALGVGVAVVTATLGTARVGASPAQAGALLGASPSTYQIGTPQVARVSGGPWTLAQGDLTLAPSYSASLPTYTPGGSGTFTSGGVTYPNLSTYPGPQPPAGVAPPYPSGFAGSPGPLAGYCQSGGANPESGPPVPQPAGVSLPMQPYYFLHLTAAANGQLTGYFDYRPKDTNEAVVAATSSDGGRSWKVVGKALEFNAGVCPNGNTTGTSRNHVARRSWG